MPRRREYALFIALMAGTAALAAVVAFAGSLLFSGPPKTVAASGPQGVARTPAARAHSTGHWLATWAAAPVNGAIDQDRGTDPALRTIRNVVHTSIGGDAARVTLSNLFGTHPLLIDRVTVNALPVTFRGAASATVAMRRADHQRPRRRPGRRRLRSRRHPAHPQGPGPGHRPPQQPPDVLHR